MTQHDYGCRHSGPHTDAAKRVSDVYNLHYSAGVLYGTTNAGKWIAVKLEDGRSDNTLYDSKSDAVWNQHHDEKYFAFMRIVPSSMSVCEAEAFLKMQREIYDAQIRLNDRNAKNGGYDIIPRLTREDQAVQDEIIAYRTGKFAIGHAA